MEIIAILIFSLSATSDDSRAVSLSVAALVVHMISDRIAPLHYDIKTMYKYWGLLQYSESVSPYYNCTKLHIKKLKAH